MLQCFHVARNKGDMFLFSLYAVAIAVGLCLYWFLHSSAWKKSPLLQVNSVSETKDPPEDGSNNSSSASNYFKGHKTPRKVQLKEVHHTNETASVKVVTPDGVTLVQTTSTTTSDRQTTKSKDEKASGKERHQHPRNNDGSKVPHKRRPAPPPPPKQPPKRPPPPPPPDSPEPSSAVVVIVDKEEPPGDVEKELQDLRIEDQGHDPNSLPRPVGHMSSSSSSPQLLGSCTSSTEAECCSSPDLPLPPPPLSGAGQRELTADEPLPPPPDTLDVDTFNRTIDSTSLVYPKNSYMSYRSEKKLGRQGFDGNYRRSFHSSSSSVDLTHPGPNFQNGDMLSPSSWEQMHNIRQHGPTVIFHSDVMQNGGSSHHPNISDSCQDLSMGEEPTESYNISNNRTKCTPDVQSSDCAVPSAASQDSNVLSVTANENSFVETSVQNSNELIEDGGETNNNAVKIMNNRAPVDQNQNSVDLNKCDSVINNNSELTIRTNSATQTSDTPKFKRRQTKSKQELECERLSMDFIHRFGDVTLKNLLVPAANHRTMSDYIDGLWSLENENSNLPIRKGRMSPEDQFKKQNGHWEENNKDRINNDNLKYKHCTEISTGQSLNEENELRKMQEELVISIRKKVENLQKEQLVIQEDMQKNEQIGKKISCKVQKLAKPNEIEKFNIHVEEMEKIMNLLLSLSGRLARAVNVLENLPKDTSLDEKRILVAKRDKLMEQHEDARRLKESIDRRSNQVSTFLHRYLSLEEFTDYEFFIKMKTKLIVDTKEIDEKINLGEQQLIALRNIMEAPQWKSANS